MVFTNPPQPVTSITIPTGATTGTPRVVIGNDIPQLLIDFYGLGIINSVIIFYTTDDNAYQYIACTTGELSMGSVFGTTLSSVHAELDMAAGQLYINNAIKLNDDDSVEAWTPVTTVNSWNSPASVQTLSYRKVPVPNKCVQIAGRVTGGTLAHIGTLPVGYRPVHDVQLPCTNNAGGTDIIANISSAGSIDLFGSFTGSDITINGIYSLEL